MFLWNVNTVKCNTYSRREPTIVPVKLSTFLLKIENELSKDLLWHCCGFAGFQCIGKQHLIQNFNALRIFKCWTESN